MFEYTLRDEHSIKCIIAKGRIDALSFPEIQNIFDELILAGDRILLVDMTSVNYVSSAGLRIFISTQKELKKVQGEIILCAITEQVFEIFRMSGLTKIFRIIANTGEIPELLRKDTAERKIITRDIGNISFEYIEEKSKKGALFVIGLQDKLENSSYTEEDAIAVKPAEMQFGCGLAALGHVYDEFKDLFGESMTVNNNFFFYPAVKHPSVDFVLNAHRDPGITCYVDCQPLRKVSLSFFHLPMVFINEVSLSLLFVVGPHGNRRHDSYPVYLNCRILRNVILTWSQGEARGQFENIKGYVFSLFFPVQKVFLHHAAIRYGTLSRSIRLIISMNFLAIAMVALFPPLAFLSFKYFNRRTGSFVMSIQVLSTR